MELDVFLREQNIRNYRKLLDTRMTPTERRIVLKLLADELHVFKNANGCRTEFQDAK